MAPAPDSPQPSVLFDATLRERNLSSLRLEAALGVVLVPLFWLLDWFVLPAHVWQTLWLRLGCTAYGALLIVASRRRPQWTERRVGALSFTFTLSVAWSICIMCWLDRGYESPYYAGLNLVIISVGFLFSWRLPVALWFTALVYGFYMAPLALGRLGVRHFPVMLSNQFFLLSTIVVTLASQRHRLSLEQREFRSSQEQKRLLDEVQALATTDWLTSLYNRRHLFVLGEREIQRTLRYGRPLCAMMVDIDHFKLINDTYGHGVGDEVIQAVARRILANVRKQDIAGRYGGEEFAILLPETDLAAARETVAERLRAAMDGEPVATTQGPLHVTLSIGVAAWSDHQANLLGLLTRADDAMYAAKRSGRNRVVTRNAEPHPAPSQPN
jgi:diguanylate cyclase (GGDEF)-like protein